MVVINLIIICVHYPMEAELLGRSWLSRLLEGIVVEVMDADAIPTS